MAEEDEAVKTAEALSKLDSPPEKVEEQPKEEAATAEKPEETPAEPEGEAPVEEKPDAKAFQAMRQRIKELESQTAQLEPLVPKLESPPPQVDVSQNQFYNAETGEFDAVGYQNAVRSEAIKAASEITNQRLDEEHQTNEAYASYPELNPQDKNFNSDLYDATSAILLQSMVKGTKLTAKQAVEKALGLTKKALKTASEEGAQKQLEDIAAKEAASLEATATSGRANEDMGDLEALSEQTRKGGNIGAEAIAERLKRSGF